MKCQRFLIEENEVCFQINFVEKIVEFFNADGIKIRVEKFFDYSAIQENSNTQIPEEIFIPDSSLIGLDFLVQKRREERKINLKKEEKIYLERLYSEKSELKPSARKLTETEIENFQVIYLLQPEKIYDYNFHGGNYKAIDETFENKAVTVLFNKSGFFSNVIYNGNIIGF